MSGLEVFIKFHFHVVEFDFYAVEKRIVIGRARSDFVKRIDHFDDAVKAVDFTLSPEDVAYLEESYVPHEVMGAIKPTFK